VQKEKIKKYHVKNTIARVAKAQIKVYILNHQKTSLVEDLVLVADYQLVN